MRFWVGITDHEWYRFLAIRQLDEVNFWQPSAHRRAVRLEPGAPFLFKLHAAQGGRIVGGGYFAHYSISPVRIAWDAFGEKNGAGTLEEMTARIARYRRTQIDADTHQIGCLALVEPFFLPEPDWIAAPADWAPNIVQGRSYESTTNGAELWSQIAAALLRADVSMPASHLFADGAERYGEPTIVLPRLGQGTFRFIVMDAYQRRCAITGERTLPVLDAAHIKPYSQTGPHRPDNGLFLRRDLHTLFDRGYVTVAPDLRVRVSPRIRREFENGRDYYALDGQTIRVPASDRARPAREYLEWHGDVVYRS